MIPTLLARQIREGVADYLRTTFPAATPGFRGLLDDLLARPEEVFRGPYVSVGLPFLQAGSAAGWFTGVSLPFPPYAHQARAFARLTGDTPRGTLVATGTGSGKTESFLLPILEHCWRMRGRPGVKALLIYPMNALATDQARRLARLIHEADGTLRDTVRAGLWVGESDTHPRGAMAPDGLITDKRVMAADPPDILLTNYKMLDILLNRPADQGLWAQNGPETLRFVAVDELHTFDGAQGTDLACLLRRLKARLGTPPGHLVGIGTSATLGGPEAGEALVAYARAIFGEPFDAASVISEERLSAGLFLADDAPEELLLPDAARLRGLADDPALTDVALGERLAPMFFAQPPAPGPGFAVALGQALRRHALFHALLRALEGRAVALEALAEALGRALPGWLLYEPEEQRLAAEALLALVALARQPDGRPFVQLRVQLWLRELRRMVASVARPPRLRFSADLTELEARHHLPVVHCRECGQLGWAGVKPERAQRVSPDLATFYEAWFRKDPEVVVLLPDDAGTAPPAARSLPARACGECLALTTAPDAEGCPACGATGLVPVLVPSLTRATERGLVGTHDCPACEGEEALTILGAQAASLSSVIVGQLFAARLNDDKKLLTFSDSVQDAAHRASFFAARTHAFGLRTALAGLLHDPATPALTL
ncbi:MAG: DEAD/DEAH box helicase, partial [Candidatus Sericytochromatia bacterium]|nr:DEAD/DEAH box helicase [Candidatus Sericytochromatia bacterium]